MTAYAAFQNMILYAETLSRHKRCNMLSILVPSKHFISARYRKPTSIFRHLADIGPIWEYLLGCNSIAKGMATFHDK